MSVPNYCKYCLRRVERPGFCSSPACANRARAAAVLESGDPEAAARMKVALLKEVARKARLDPCVFFEFIARQEETHARMKVTAHQRVLFSFVSHPNHPQCAVIIPREHSKTTSLLAYGLYKLAQNTNTRGLVVSATQQQAKNVVNLMRQIIESESQRLQLVNPRLKRSRRTGDPWSDTSFTVERDYGAKDPSFQAVGIDSKTTLGKRLDFCLADDLLNPENTATPEQRRKVVEFVDMVVKGCMVPDSRLVFCNTVFHSKDLMCQLMETRDRGGYGMPTLKMSATGDVWVYNADPGWECPDLVRYGAGSGSRCRLAAHEPDPEFRKTLWPLRFPPERLQAKREEYAANPGAFARLYLSDTRDDSTSMCKQEFIDRCLERARNVGWQGWPSKTEDFLAYYGRRPPGVADAPIAGYERYMTVTGVDLAFTLKDTNDRTAFVTIECNRPDGYFRIIDIEAGRWDTMAVADKAIDKARRFNSVLAVESVGGQAYMVDIIRHKLGIKDDRGRAEMDKFIHVEPLMTTAAAKANPDYGLGTLFYEMARGMWLIPNRNGVVRREVDELLEACRNYQPSKHTDDIVMAWFMARWLASKWGGLVKPSASGGGDGGLGGGIMAR
jgi:hypothetical protein